MQLKNSAHQRKPEKNLIGPDQLQNLVKNLDHCPRTAKFFWTVLKFDMGL